MVRPQGRIFLAASLLQSGRALALYD